MPEVLKHVDFGACKHSAIWDMGLHGKMEVPALVSVNTIDSDPGDHEGGVSNNSTQSIQHWVCTALGLPSQHSHNRTMELLSQQAQVHLSLQTLQGLWGLHPNLKGGGAG